MSALIQGSEEWLALRRTKVTATDAAVIVGMNPWKNIEQLYVEKTTAAVPFRNERMERGNRLEPVARALFCSNTGRNMIPKVVLKDDWAMASLDGIDDLNEILEIKCPGEKVHQMALEGTIPQYYYPQLQHQMFVCDSEKAFYYSFDGESGVTVEVERNQEFIDRMVEKEKAFYECLVNKTPPKLHNERIDIEWIELANTYTCLTRKIKMLQEQADNAKAALLSLAGESEQRGGGISISWVERKGTIDYLSVKELKGVDLEPYRKPNTGYWQVREC